MMFNRALLFSAAAIIAIASNTYAADNWHLREGAIVCPSYFQMREAEEAASRSAEWFAQTGCVRSFGKPKVVFLDDFPSENVTVRVRLLSNAQVSQSGYVRLSNVMGYVGNKELWYKEARRAEWAAYQAAHPLKNTPASDAAFAAAIAKAMGN